MRPHRIGAALLGASALTAVLTACGAAKPAAVPDNGDLWSCLSQAGVSTGSLDTYAARRTAFEEPAPWDCVLQLSSPADRHAVLGGVYPADASSLLAALTAWIGTQKSDGKSLADDLGTLLAAADDPLPSDSAKASLRSQADDILQDKLSVALYQHVDGEPPGLAAYRARPDLQGDPDVLSRYYNDLMDKGGPVADRLRGYTSIIDGTRDRLRAT